MTVLMRDASVVLGTMAEVVAKTGIYTGQMGLASDHGLSGQGLRMVWNGSAWRLPPFWQKVAQNRTQTTLPADTNELTYLTYTLHALGANDQWRIEGMVLVNNNANAKTVKGNLGATGVGTGAAIDFASNTAGLFVIQGRNANDASAQKWMSNSKAIFGGLSGSLQTTTRATGTAGVTLAVAGLKGTAGDTLTFEYADIWLCGG